MDGWFDSPIESAKQAYSDAVGQWQSMLTALDAAVADFNSITDVAAADPTLSEQWATANNHLTLFQDTINGVKSAIDTIVGWFGSFTDAVGLSGYGPQRMGALPVLAWIAIITAGVAAGYALIDELRQVYIAATNAKIAQQNIVNAQQGKPPIPYITLGASSSGLFSGLSDTAKWVSLGVLGFLVLQFMEKRRS